MALSRLAPRPAKATDQMVGTSDQSGPRRAVFLDRDGVINRSVIRDGKPYAPMSLDALEFLPGVGKAMHSLREADFRIIVVTNQPDVRAGRQRQEVVEAIHARMKELLPIDEIRVCYHTDEDGCRCRKPKPGMLVDAAHAWGLDLARSFMVGDRWRDVEAGKAAGCRTILVRGNYVERQAEGFDAVATSLLEASALILAGRS